MTSGATHYDTYFMLRLLIYVELPCTTWNYFCFRVLVINTCTMGYFTIVTSSISTVGLNW